MFGFLKRKNDIEAKNNEIIAIADGKLVDINTVDDDTFSQQMLGPSIAFRFNGDKVEICSPVNGVLTVLFPTGHAFGITTEDGVEVLVHIGIDTVTANGNGFKVGKVTQGMSVKAGQPIVEVDLKKLSQSFDMTTMLIITNSNNRTIIFNDIVNVNQGDVVAIIK